MFIAIAYMYEMKQQVNGVIYITEGFQDTQRSLYNELNNEFKNDLEEWNAFIDSKSLSIIFKEPDVLFKKGRYSIKDKFKSILVDFFPRYIDVLNSQEYRTKILSIRIEGHTSSEWKKGMNEKEAYLKNMALSQMRASEVLKFALNTRLNGSYKWIRDRLVAVGFSSSKIKFNDNKIEDRQQSRRVEFKVVTNTQEQLYDLVAIISKGREK